MVPCIAMDLRRSRAAFIFAILFFFFSISISSISSEVSALTGLDGCC